jgi:hypothetical protein
MCDDDFRYVLELFRRESNVSLKRVPVQADWVPVVEDLTFSLVRRGLLADYSRPLEVRIEPELMKRTFEPVVRRVRATARLDSERVESIVVPIEYFRPLARRAADKLMESGLLQPGDLFEYRVLAYKQGPAAPRPLRFVMENTPAPIAIMQASAEDLLDRAIQFGDPEGDQVRVFVHWQVLEQVSVRTRQAGELETGGVLIGYVHRDPASAEIFIEITAQIPADARSELTRLSFTPDTWSHVHSAVQARGGGEIWLGWWHSHSFFKHRDEKRPGEVQTEDQAAKQSAIPFLSSEDRLLHRTVFPRAYSVALLITDSPTNGMSWGLFGWQSTDIARRSFHVIHAPLPEAFTALRGEQHAAT